MVDSFLAAERLSLLVRDRQKAYVCVAPVSTIVEARRDAEYQKVLNEAAMVTPDGAPVAWIGRLNGHRQVRRTYGPDLMLKMCDEGRASGLRHFFYGGTPEVCDRLERSLKERFPGILVVGKIAPPFAAKAERLTEQARHAIHAARPDILWVALGSPKQDFWMALNRDALDVPVMVGVGAAFDFLAGAKPQAPRWMGRMGLEWLFRLCCEPRRLWKRYLIGNALFVWFLFRDGVRGRRDART
ncbi:MAG: WecB/TagA/CpsF family glycosyltransferase [Elusimicrobia bacterium]|nr:WecB/TagA/CpsF family glycosyltransferase [Elusimicrobiota bacterium]